MEDKKAKTPSVYRIAGERRSVPPSDLPGIGNPGVLTASLTGNEPEDAWVEGVPRDKKSTQEGEEENVGTQASVPRMAPLLSSTTVDSSAAEMVSCEDSVGETSAASFNGSPSAVSAAVAGGDISHLPGMSEAAEPLDRETGVPNKRKRDFPESPESVQADSDSEPRVGATRRSLRLRASLPEDSLVDPSLRRKARKPRKKRLKKVGAGQLSSEPPCPEVPEVLPRKARRDYSALSSAEIAGKARGWLDEVDELRAKSSHLKGKISGIMKNRFIRLKEVVTVFSERAEDSGDVPFLRQRNIELTGQLRVAKRREDQLKEDLNGARKRVAELSIELKAFKDRLGSKSTSEEVDRPLTARGVQDGGDPRKRVRVLSPGGPLDAGHVAMGGRRRSGSEARLQKCEDTIAGLQRDIDSLRGRSRGVEPSSSTRALPGVLEDIQIRPPLAVRKRLPSGASEVAASSDSASWAGVVRGRGAKRRVRGAWRPSGGPAPIVVPSSVDASRQVGRLDSSVRPVTRDKAGPAIRPGKDPPRRRVPRAAAVALRSANQEVAHSELLKRAKQCVSLGEVEIAKPRIRMAANGGFLIEIAGSDGTEKADTLARKLKETLGPEAVVSRPIAKGELRIMGLDSSVSVDELRAAVVDASGCADGDIRVDPFRRTPSGLYSVWAQCPLAAANSLASSGVIKVGWTMARVTLLRARPIQCFRCLEYGHVRNKCQSQTDRSSLCFNCGKADHQARNCVFPPCCVVCENRGMNPNHRMGSVACTGVRDRNRGVHQVNVNHSRYSQDLVFQWMTESEVGVCCIAEPWGDPANHSQWFASKDAVAAIRWNPDFTGPGCSAFYRADNIIGVSVNGLSFISVYISPNIPIGEYLEVLDRLADAVGSAPCPVIVCGDFYAKSLLWGSPVGNRRGEVLCGLADQLNLVLCNVGDRPTCVRPQGSSVVDLTWVSASWAACVSNWCVLGDVETLSDHRLISFSVTRECGDQGITHTNGGSYPRWSLAGLDVDLLTSAFSLISSGIDADAAPDSLAGDIKDWITDSCDLAARRCGSRPPKRSAYWWNEEVIRRPLGEHASRLVGGGLEPGR
ncbi:PREDICTED: uncharacterized protein LOC105556923 [Vollenhovia emeryi]|uniref:uncharacterized protein LOC105556923 n=1 Tax=Vollenhovia emeryi TaxID=411798 RepID=UPI0005F56710|nr:PREDICTED: uncharacterized protein LOC105556923 [Vollenhovia emeryi]